MRRDVGRPAVLAAVLLLGAAAVLAAFGLLRVGSYTVRSTAATDACRVASSCGYHAAPLDPFLAPPPLVMAAPSPLRHIVEVRRPQPAEAFVDVLQRPPITA